MNWRQTLEISPLIEVDPTNGLDFSEEQVRDIAQKIIEVLKTARFGQGSRGPVIVELRSAKTENGLNRALNALYDWADDARVWIG